MRKIIASAQVSLDGVMQGQGGAQEDISGGFDLGGWSMKFSDAKTGAAIMGGVGTLDQPYDLLLGRKTYDIFASYWPFVSADNPIGPVFTKANKYVLTRGAAKLDWANSHKMRNLDDLRKVKAGDGPDIVLWGSSTLYPPLLEANLIDRFLLLTCPIVLGKGKKLFGTTSHPVNMKLVRSDISSTGVIIATYEPQG
ncbi:MAG TPA: dihydrofolate reductase family protein [Candidatus Angelobacter sp.]|nr:dihydrofolate reductase family protein [Candidatus Angelobacter sp.]